jgi:hypothetical protein
MASLATVLSAQSPGLVAQPGSVTVEPPTTGALGVEWRIQGDDNRNASVALAWRRTGETTWRDGLPLMRLQGEAVLQGASFQYIAPNMFAGSVFNLVPDTSYDIRLRLTDPDAPAGSAPVERTVTGRTRPVPKPATGGAVYHVYPRDYTGTKLQPNFSSLMAAYNTGANGADFVNSFQPRVKPGDVILIHAGTYREDRRRYAGPNSTLFDGTFYLTADGTADKPIVIKGAGDGEVIFDGDGNAVLFDLTAADHHYVEGITVRNTEGDDSIPPGWRGTDCPWFGRLRAALCSRRGIHRVPSRRPCEWAVSETQRVRLRVSGPRGPGGFRKRGRPRADERNADRRVRPGASALADSVAVSGR